jgi:hypothetical protein
MTVGFVQPFNGTSVGGGFYNQYSSADTIEVYAICAPGSTTTPGEAATSRSASAGDNFESKLGAFRASSK